MKSPFPKETYEKNAKVYKILSNSKRLEILNLLKKGELPVELLVKTLKLPKANVSQHLAVLRHTGLVTMHRDGLNVYYKIIDPRVIEPCRILYDLRRTKTI